MTNLELKIIYTFLFSIRKSTKKLKTLSVESITKGASEVEDIIECKEVSLYSCYDLRMG